MKQDYSNKIHFRDHKTANTKCAAATPAYESKRITSDPEKVTCKLCRAKMKVGYLQ